MEAKRPRSFHAEFLLLMSSAIILKLFLLKGSSSELLGLIVSTDIKSSQMEWKVNAAKMLFILDTVEINT